MRKSRHRTHEGVRKYFQPKDSDERQIADRRRGHTASANGHNGMVFSPTTVGVGGQPVSVSGGYQGVLLMSPASNTQPAHEATVDTQVNVPRKRPHPDQDPASEQAPAEPLRPRPSTRTLPETDLLATIIRATYTAMSSP